MKNKIALAAIVSIFIIAIALVCIYSNPRLSSPASRPGATEEEPLSGEQQDLIKASGYPDVFLILMKIMMSFVLILKRVTKKITGKCKNKLKKQKL